MTAPRIIPRPRVSEWRKLPLSLAELCIDTTLRCGQSFRWKKINDTWHCALHGRIISLTQDHTHLHYQVTWPNWVNKPESEDDTAALLRNYFALSVPVASLYKEWQASDANFARRAPAFTGIRILNQDAWETLVSFICSANNNISRISSMVQKLCVHYGPYIGTIEGEAFHDFPEPIKLSGKGEPHSQVEAHLRQLGFGYRAQYIAETAWIVAEKKPADWLLGLRNPSVPPLFGGLPLKEEVKKEEKEAEEEEEGPPSYRAAHEAMMTLSGVGPKVADCVCLMGLGWWESVPVDTHVWQIAQRDYNFGKGIKTKTFTKGMYNSVGDHFRKIWGPYAGWAQSVLFTANLKSFAEQASNGKAKKGEMVSTTTTAVVAKAVTVERGEGVAGNGGDGGDGDGLPAPLLNARGTRKRKVTSTMEVVKTVKVEKTKEENIVEQHTTTTRRMSKRIRARS
ncbi:DNA glycosylase [Podospora australis]|uniref:DNA-(apurinic or apyrimidinic site) lyase n=1 Tax=Podospora australis TaxID=1536484 RepID=A0AAN6WWM6_9PEZI|nr:DNA glycosylase [Podospora australis]